MLESMLFSPLKLRDLTLKNRIIVSPMCMYSATNGIPNIFHQTHLGAMALGGSAVVMVEATGVVMEGRISTGCLSLSNDEQEEAFKPIIQIIKAQNAIPAIQLAHAGRKASFAAPTDTSPSVLLNPNEGGWITVAPSALSFDDKSAMPHALTKEEILNLVDDFVKSAKRALRLGFEIIEIHSAHGYLLHEFLSPLSNKREDEFGGSLENRMRFPLMVARALRELWPQNLPVFVRLSATDWTSDGWTINDSVLYAKELKKLGIDLIDVSTGGNVHAKIPLAPGYQVQFSNEIKQKAQIDTGAVGLITEARQAENILLKDEATVIFLARTLLKNPNWPLNAAKELNAKIKIPGQYARGI